MWVGAASWAHLSFLPSAGSRRRLPDSQPQTCSRRRQAADPTDLADQSAGSRWGLPLGSTYRLGPGDRMGSETGATAGIRRAN